MNTYISTILIILSLFTFSVMSYEWGNKIIDDSLNKVNHVGYTNQLKILEDSINSVVVGGVNSTQNFKELKISSKKGIVIISNRTENISFKITCIDGINSLNYNMYVKNNVLYVFIYNFTVPYSEISFVKNKGYRICSLNGNVTITYCGNTRYYYTNSSKIYIYNILTG